MSKRLWSVLIGRPFYYSLAGKAVADPVVASGSALSTDTVAVWYTSRWLDNYLALSDKRTAPINSKVCTLYNV